jgi:hypothetical protein
MVQIHLLTCAQVLQFGLDLVGFDGARQRRTRAAANIKRFRAAYGVGPGACSAVYRDLQITSVPDARINRPNIFFCLLSLNWLSTYKKEAEMAGFFHSDDKTLRKHIAERLLKIDIDAGKHNTMKPRELQATRPEYSPYPLKVFRDHVQQERRARCESSYWLARILEKKKEKEKRMRQE